MVFKRKVYDKLLEWKKLSAGASAVLLEGARRIGKSTIVEEFAKNEYDDYMILDFARENKDVRNNFIENMDDLDSFFRNLFLLKGKSLNGKNCVIIFDEVQLFTNLDQLPVTGFKVSCFPVSIKAASAGWARVVAFVE